VGNWKRAVAITDQHQRLFSRLSGDMNPEHVSESRSALVFGGLTALLLCGEALKHVPLQQARYEVIFVRPVSIDAPYTIVTAATALRVSATLKSEDNYAVILRLTATQGPGNELEHQRVSDAESALISGDYQTNRDALAALHGSMEALGRVPPDFIETMALASYVLGMRLPTLGRFAGCEGILDRARQVREEIEYSAVVRRIAGRQALVILNTSDWRAVLHLRRTQH